MTGKAALALALLAMSFLGTEAIAHSKLSRSDPGNGSVVSVAPATLTLSFVEDIRLTRVSMTPGEGDAVDLDLSNVATFGREFDFDLPLDMTAGQHQVDWRGIGVDGHLMQGSFGFTVEQ
ncbi:MAG: copper resistance CopC family protein [Pseudomonadota bacterium]